MAEFFNNIFITSVDMKNILNFGSARGGKTRNQHRRTGSQVICLDGSAFELFNSLNNRKLAVCLYLSAHSVKLLRIAETV